MSDISETKTKRSYTVPILLLIIAGLSVLIVVLYSRLLLTEQSRTTDEGKRLAERYNIAMAFAGSLHEGAVEMLSGTSEAKRLNAKEQFGEAFAFSGETVGLFADAARLSGGKSADDANKKMMLAINEVIGFNSPLSAVGEHDGPLNEQDIAILSAVLDGSLQIQTALQQFTPPTGAAGFRQMSAGGDWVAAAKGARQALEALAGKLPQ
jgi:hypothetical protein